MSCASFAGWTTGQNHTRCRSPRRGWEIAGIVLGFIFAWPAALAYLIWKFMGYPVPNEFRAFFAKHFSSAVQDVRRAASPFAPFATTGNAAFDDYRAAELKRLEEERRRLDEEAQAFGAFVDDLRRAKDREEFDAFMAKRRSSPGAAPAA